MLRAAVFDFSGSFFHVFFFLSWLRGALVGCFHVCVFMHICGLDLISKFTLFFFFVILALNHSKDLNGEPATVFLASLR